MHSYVIFGKNGLLEIGDNLDDDEVSLFIDENRNVHETKKTKTDLNVRLRGSVKEQGARTEDIPSIFLDWEFTWRPGSSFLISL